MEKNATIIALSGKGGVGKTSISAAIVKLLVEAYPDKKILAIDADPAVGLSTALGIDVETVRNYFGGKHFEAKACAGIHIEQGPDGGVVTLDDTAILDAAMRILNEGKEEVAAEE